MWDPNEIECGPTKSLEKLFHEKLTFFVDPTFAQKNEYKGKK